MYCRKCGNQIEDGSKYCPKCGQIVEGSDDVLNKNKETVTKENNLIGSKDILKKKLWIFPMNEAITFGLSILIFISCLLPFASVSAFGITQTINYISADGMIVTGLLVINCFLVKLKYHKTSMVFSILPCIIVLYDFVYSTNVTEGMASYSIGAYLCLILSIALACIGIYVFVENKKIK